MRAILLRICVFLAAGVGPLNPRAVFRVFLV